MKWGSIEEQISDCEPKVLRNSPGIKCGVLIGRNDDSLRDVRAIFVSQEPSHYYREPLGLKDGNSVRLRILETCADRNHPDRRNRTNLVSEICRLAACDKMQFDPGKDKIYWTHALKCVPASSNSDIGKDWNKCAPSCVRILREEIRLCPSKRIALVAIGGWALGMCLGATSNETEDLRRIGVPKITDFIWNSPLPVRIGKFDLYAFIHPSHKEQVLALLKKGTQRTKAQPERAEEIRAKIKTQEESLLRFLSEP